MTQARFWLPVLDLHPEWRGMSSFLQAFIATSANGLVAGVVVPLARDWPKSQPPGVLN